MRIVPTNPFAALASGDFLAVIFFAIIFGIGILSIGDQGKPLKDLMESATEVMLKLIGWVMETAPIGVFALIAWVSGTQGVRALMDVIPLAGTAVLAVALHFFMVYGGLMKFVLKLSPYNFFRDAKNATLVAFSTSSSSATLPVTISVAEKNLGTKNAKVSDSCFDLISAKSINTDNLKNCGDPLFLEWIDWIRADARGLSRDTQKKRFERSFKNYMLDQQIQRTNIAAGLIWDTSRDNVFAPSRVELALSLPEFSKLRSQVYKNLTVEDL
jgi:hypothetical protein